MKNIAPDNSPPPLRFFLYCLLTVAGIGAVLAYLTFFTGIYSSRELSFCLSSGCLSGFLDTQKETVRILSGTLSILVSISTIGAIIVALMTYISTMKTSALTNHISHLKTFQDYVLNEVEKFPSVSKTSINTLVWYNIIYDRSRDGDMTISTKYRTEIKEISKEIELSNTYSNDATQPSFSYLEHQTTLIEALNKIGLIAARDTRAGFFESEEQLFSLIDNVNKEFCGDDSLTLPARLYK